MLGEDKSVYKNSWKNPLTLTLRKGLSYELPKGEKPWSILSVN